MRYALEALQCVLNNKTFSKNENKQELIKSLAVGLGNFDSYTIAFRAAFHNNYNFAQMLDLDKVYEVLVGGSSPDEETISELVHKIYKLKEHELDQPEICSCPLV